MLKSAVSFLLLAFLSFALPSSMGQSSEDSPYIYFYSQEQQAFLIQRADGSDSQILASYELPEGHVFIEGAGWSPSGQWFAWTSSGVGGTGGYKNIYLTDGDQTISLFSESTARPVDMAWSPTDDLLLVSFYPNLEIAVQDVLVFDPVTNTIVFHSNAEALTGDAVYWLRYVGWSPNGQYLSLLNGRTLELVGLSNEEQITIPTPTVPFTGCSAFGTLPYWLTDDTLVYLDQSLDALVIENVLHQGSRNTIELPDGQVKLIDWSPEGNHALIYMRPSPDDNKYELWLLSLQDWTISLVHTSVRFSNNCTEPYNESLWGTSSRAVFITQNNELGILTLRSESPISVDTISDIQVIENAPMRWLDSTRVFFVGQSKSRQSHQIYKLDAETGEIFQVVSPEDNGSLSLEYISPIRYDHLVFDNVILDVTRNTQEPLFGNVQSFGLSPFITSYIQWYSSDEWLFALGTPFDIIPTVYVTDLDKSVQRRLGTCLPHAIACYGWLPEVKD